MRFVRGAGVKQARWGDVDDAVTADVAGAPCVVLRLKDGRTTSIPVEVLAVERDAFRPRRAGAPDPIRHRSRGAVAYARAARARGGVA